MTCFTYHRSRGEASGEHRLSSTDRRNSPAKHFGWFHPIQGLSRAVVQLPGDGVEMSGAVEAQVILAREVLAEQTVGVLIAAALPWAVGVAEVDHHVRVRAEPYVVSHLFAQVSVRRSSAGSLETCRVSAARKSSAVRPCGK